MLCSAIGATAHSKLEYTTRGLEHLYLTLCKMFLIGDFCSQTVVWSTVALTLTALCLLIWKRQDKQDAPLVPGLPVIGNALALGRHGVAYIHQCRQKFGDSFSLSLAGVKMTFLFEPANIDYFFSAPDDKISFRPAVEQFTQRVFGLTSRHFFPLHFKMLTELRHLLVPGALAEHMQVLGVRALQLLPCYVHHAQVDLWSLCRGLIFHCGMEVVFGRRFVDELGELLQLYSEEEEEQEQEHEEGGLDGDGAHRGPPQCNGGPSHNGHGAASKAAAGELSPWQALKRAVADGQHPELLPRAPPGVQRLAQVFFTFEEGFELAASPVPHILQTEFVRSRAALLRVLRAADKRGLFQGTPAGELLDRTTGLPTHLRPNLLLALVWASQANTIPAAFWSVAFLLLPENAGHKAAVVAELQRELEATSLQSKGPEAGVPPGVAGANGAAGIRGADSATSQPSASEVVAAAARLAANRRSAASRCVAEALRLRGPSIDVRLAASALDLPSSSKAGARLRLPRGRVLAVCPFESHHDPKLHGSGGAAADPWVFDPNRPEIQLGDGRSVLPSVAGMSFGGGAYRCPGRFLAEQELALLVQLLLWSYDVTLSYGDATSRSSRQGQQSPSPSPSKADKAAGTPADRSTAHRPAAAAAAPGAAVQPESDPHGLRAVQGGSILYAAMALLVGPAALAWGCGWFDGLDGPMQEWRRSGDPAGLLPPCDLRRLVGLKVPRKPCWVQLGRPNHIAA